jgi:hypothetical protein
VFDAELMEHEAPEHARLVREHFADLALADQRQYIEVVESGPTPETYADGEGLPPGQAEVWLRARRLRRLRAVSPFLPAEVRARYPELADANPPVDEAEGADEIRDIPFPNRAAPLGVDDLLTLPLGEVIKHLREWKPEGDFFGPTLRSQGDVLVAAARRDPARFSGHALEFRGLDPTYVRSLFGGLHDALKEDKATLAWGPTLALAHWAVDQPVTKRDEPFERDPGFGWTRKAIADLIGDALERRENALPLARRQEVWALVEILADDTMPSGLSSDEGRDPLMTALNSTHGEAIQAIVTYLDWVQRQDPTPTRPAFEVAPEVDAVLMRHLDPSRDRTIATRGAIGARLANLTALDAGWVAKQRRRIFPNDEAPELAVATWRTYVVWNRPFKQLLDLFRDEYSAAIRRTVAEPIDAQADPDKHLGQHLMSFYLRGDLEFDDPLLQDFFALSPVRVRAQAVEFLGHVLHDDEAVTDVHCARLQQLWEFRIGAAKAEGDRGRDELEQFGWWFSGKSCDEEWLLAQLLQVLGLIGRIEPDSLVLEKLAAIAPRHPVEAVRAIELLVRAPKERWFIQANFPEIQSVLRAGIASAESREPAADLVNRLVADGYASLGSLLPGT